MRTHYRDTTQAALSDVAHRLRRGATSSQQMTAAFLDRIAAIDPKLGAFSHVAAAAATSAAAALDRALGAGIDLGPLMGVPIALKDLYAVEGMPMTLGSTLDVSDIEPRQGPLVSDLRRAGAVILGKTRMTEFALGTINLAHDSPWNPCDAGIHRTPGGSSGGSAVAVAAGLCAIALGSDTGGSVRQPAACCGVVGYKASNRLWSNEGVFPLAPTFDSVGVFSRSVNDLQQFYGALVPGEPIARRPVAGLRLGRPVEHYFDNLQPAVAAGFEWAEGRLREAGAEVVPIHVPEAAEIDAVFAKMIPVEFLATVGVDRFLAGRDRIDPVAFARARLGIDVKAVEYVELYRRHLALARAVDQSMVGLDGWIMPTMPCLPVALDGITDVDAGSAWNILATQNTRPGNLFQQCGISLPIFRADDDLPIGFQIMGRNGRDAELLAVAAALETVFDSLPGR